MNWDAFVAKALTVPFQDLGRSWEGWDCWGLIVLARKAIFDLDTPDYIGQYDSVDDLGTVRRLFAADKHAWNCSQEPSYGALALVYRRGVPLHVGIVGPTSRYMLHCEERLGTVQEPLRTMRVEGFYT